MLYVEHYDPASMCLNWLFIIHINVNYSGLLLVSLHFGAFMALNYAPDQTPDINSLDASCLASK